jgi:1-acyl-sn-glycerol-3-phosphate acyltransferase
MGRPAEPVLRRLARRTLSCSLVGVAFVIGVALLPLLPLLALVDVVTGLSLARAFAFIVWYLLCEAVGIIAATLLWLRRLVQRPDAETWWAWNYGLQARWARALFGAAERCFSLRVDVHGDEACVGGAIVLLSRHASVADTVLPAVFVAARHGVRLRTVLKRELLWDPCLDIVGQRIPNAFVGRDGKDSAGEIGKVEALARDLGDGDGVLIYPEGTRFSPSKLQRVRARLEASHDAGRSDVRMRDLARQLTHVLPPQLGGVMAALAAAPQADVVICTHVGFDGIRTFGDLVRGTLVRRHVRVHFRRLPRAVVPVDTDARVGWLLGEWREVDRQVGAVLAAPQSAAPVG